MGTSHLQPPPNQVLSSVIFYLGLQKGLTLHLPGHSIVRMSCPASHQAPKPGGPMHGRRPLELLFHVILEWGGQAATVVRSVSGQLELL